MGNINKMKNVVYLIKVVLPTPGGPITKMEPPPSIKSRMISALPETARPTRQVRPMICILRFRIALIRCKELLIPDRLSSEKSPTYIKGKKPYNSPQTFALQFTRLILI